MCSSAISGLVLKQISSGTGALPVRLLAELSAVLVRHPDRVLPLFGDAGVVDNPRRDRSVTLNLWQYQLANFGQDHLVRPRSLADKMQQGLMLCARSIRRRDGRHRLNALAGFRNN